MFKNKIYKFAIFIQVVFVFSFGFFVYAEDVLPDNVKITTDKDGSITTVIINSKPGFSTSVQTNCTNGKCTSSAVSNQITEKNIQEMKDDIRKHQEAIEKFWQAQEKFFKEQQKIFEDLWGINWF